VRNDSPWQSVRRLPTLPTCPTPHGPLQWKGASRPTSLDLSFGDAGAFGRGSVFTGVDAASLGR
jgi:hypothetical protein